jgi:hypothetical protein
VFGRKRASAARAAVQAAAQVTTEAQAQAAIRVARQAGATSGGSGASGGDDALDPELVELEQLMIEELLLSRLQSALTGKVPDPEASQLLHDLQYQGPVRTAAFERLKDWRRQGIGLTAPPGYALVAGPPPPDFAPALDQASAAPSSPDPAAPQGSPGPAKNSDPFGSAEPF